MRLRGLFLRWTGGWNCREEGGSCAPDGCENFLPSQWRTECPPERFVEGEGCTTRGDSLRVAQVMWLRGGCGGCCVRHCLGKRRGVTL